jgi:hypothetical protein
MDEEGLCTILVSTEASFSSGPSSQNDDEVLTPAHFLVGEQLITIPNGPELQRRTNLPKEFKLQ